MKSKFTYLAALVLALSPSLALASTPQFNGGHSHSITIHDRSPRIHERGSVAHH